ncbi:MAG: HlyD family secretion protein [Armatimonadota bacterium]
MKERLRIIIPVLIVLAVGVYLLVGYFNRSRQADVREIPGNGVIEATEVDISSKVAGKVVKLPWNEGDDVQAGQLIALLDSEELAGQVEQAQGNLSAAEANYAELAAGTRAEDIRRAQAQYDAALNTLKQAQARRDLVMAGSREELIAQLRAVYDQAQARLALVKAGPRQEDIAQLKAAYEQAQAQLSLVKEGPRKEEIAQLEAALAQVRVTLKDAQTELNRVKRLYEEGAVASKLVDQATTRRDVAQATVEAAEQRLAQAKNGARPQEVQQAQAAVEIARQRLQEAQTGARPEEIREASAAVEAARQQLEQAKNGPRPQERRDAQAAVAAAQAQANAARATLDLALAGPRQQTLDAAKARVAQAQGNLKTAQASAGQTKILAPSSGRVTLRNAEPGELVTPGMPIIRLAKLETVWMRIYVPEKQIGRVHIGQTADIITDAYTDKQYTGRVIEISQEAEFTPKNVQTKEERVKQVFGVKIEIENPDKELKPGMPGDAIIHVGRLKDEG